MTLDRHGFKHKLYWLVETNNCEAVIVVFYMIIDSEPLTLLNRPHGAAIDHQQFEFDISSQLRTAYVEVM